MRPIASWLPFVRSVLSIATPDGKNLLLGNTLKCLCYVVLQKQIIVAETFLRRTFWGITPCISLALSTSCLLVRVLQLLALIKRLIRMWLPARSFILGQITTSPEQPSPTDPAVAALALKHMTVDIRGGPIRTVHTGEKAVCIKCLPKSRHILIVLSSDGFSVPIVCWYNANNTLIGCNKKLFELHRCRRMSCLPKRWGMERISTNKSCLETPMVKLPSRTLK